MNWMLLLFFIIVNFSNAHTDSLNCQEILTFRSFSNNPQVRKSEFRSLSVDELIFQANIHLSEVFLKAKGYEDSPYLPGLSPAYSGIQSVEDLIKSDELIIKNVIGNLLVLGDDQNLKGVRQIYYHRVVAGELLLTILSR